MSPEHKVICLLIVPTEYKKSKNSDVIASLISLFESRDVFVKEFQKILGERLLKKEFDFDKEVSFPFKLRCDYVTDTLYLDSSSRTSKVTIR